MRASDYIAISEKIRSRELKLQGELSEINSKISSLYTRIDSLESEFEILQMELNEALSETDEDGNVDMGVVGAIRSRMSVVRSQISSCQSEVSIHESEKQKVESELQSVETEKQTTLSDIQSAATVKSRNMSKLAGGLSEDYASIGQNLQSAFQVSLGQLSQAASILGGSISAGTGGGFTGASSSSEKRKPPLSSNIAAVGGTGSKKQVSVNDPELSMNPVSMTTLDKRNGVLSSTPSTGLTAKHGSSGQFHSESKKIHNGSNLSGGMQGATSGINGMSVMASALTAKEMTSLPRSTGQAISPSNKPHTFRDYLNPVNYDSDGHYTGDYRTPVIQTAQAVADYNSWNNNGGIGLPSTDLRKNGGVIETIVPAQNIFDVYDSDNPSFWNYKSRPQSDYIAMAACIPLVRRYLESGKSIADVEAMGGIVGACATNYFRNPVKVMKAGQAYIHCSDGRHRTVAAQIAKVEVPVCVVQDFSINNDLSISTNMSPVQIQNIPKNQILSGKISVFSKHSSKLGANFVDDMHNILRSTSHTDISIMYQKYADNITIYEAQDINGRALYKHGTGVIFNTNAVKNGSRIHKPYQVAFHEFGHNLDYILGKGIPISEKWGNGALYEAIKYDFNVLKGTKSNEELIDALRQQKKEYKWTNMAIASVSDILECMTGIDYPLGSGHGQVTTTVKNLDGSTTEVVHSYWKDRLPCKEFFAEVLDGAIANEESYNMLKAMFPNAVRIVHKIVGGVIE